MMKVAVLSYLSVNDPRKGGSEVHAFKVAEGLSKIGYDVAYIHGPPHVKTNFSRDIVLTPPLRHRRGFALVNYYLFNIQALYRLTRLRPKVVITSNFNLAAKLFGLLTNSPVVMIFYQLGYGSIGEKRGALARWVTQGNSPQRRMRAFLMYLHNEFPLRVLRFARIVTLSHYAKRVCEAVKVRTPPHLIVNLGTGVDPCDCPPEDKIYDVCCMTRLVSYKRVDVAIQALRILNNRRPGVSCIIVGDGEERKRLEAQAQGLPVYFLGWLEGVEKHKALGRSRIFCLPSPLEGFGIVFLEAMAHSLPLAYCNQPPMNEELRGCGLGFKDGDAEDLAATIELLLNDKALAEKLGTAGRSLAADKFLWPKVAQRYHELISRL